MSDILDRYHHIADGFSARVSAVPPGDERWSAPAPCDGWTARDVVRHVLEANSIFFGLVDHDPGEPTCSVDDDPGGAWEESRAAMERALGDPSVAAREFDGMFGRTVWAESIDRFLTDDVLVHSWDLARAMGLDERLDADDVHRMYEELTGRDKAMQDAMRRPDVYGPPVKLPAGASEQDRLLAFTGRDPR